MGGTFQRAAAIMGVAALPVLCADWNPRLAAEYLDARQKAWFEWKTANAPGGPCVSCHTGLTYLLARPALRRALGEKQPTAYEAGLTAGFRARAGKREPTEIFPAFQKEPLASQAAGVEAIFAALFLASEDPPRAEQALDRMWSMQIRDGSGKGSWPWFSLNLDPWEMPESGFFGATLAAMAAGGAPAEYRKQPEVAPRIAELVAYLKREQAQQPLHNRLMLLWASTKLPEALPSAARESIISETLQKQQADGGWTLAALGPWKLQEGAPRAVGSSGYATAFAAFALRTAGVGKPDPRLQRALQWLASHQDREKGYWSAESMNKKYDASSMPAAFMRDAATGFAALALIE